MLMGCSVACAAFETFSTFLDCALRYRTGLLGVLHYLDDFLLIGKSNNSECASLLEAVTSLMQELGVPLAADKTEGPVTTLTFLGIQLDTIAQSSRLPLDKLVALKEFILQILPLRKVTLRQIQSLLGHLNFACRVASPGRLFCARLARLSAGLKSPHDRVHLPKSVKADLEIWLSGLFISISDGPLPVISTSGSPAARTFPGPPLEPWKRVVIKGVLASVAPSSLRSYKKAWCDFLEFQFKEIALTHGIPPTTDHALQCLAHLHNLGHAAKTLKIHIAAITFFSKSAFSFDPCADFIVHRATEGWSRLQPSKKDGRRPITFGLLSLIRRKLRSICWSKYEAQLFSAAYAVAFFGALRVWKVVAETQSISTSRGLLLEDIQLSSSELVLHIQRSKMDQNGRGALIKLAASKHQGPCPVKDIRRYLSLRSACVGPLFIHEDGSRLMRHQFTRALHKAIDACGFPANEYAAHSFRIGAATMASHLGLPTDRIKVLGRWKSNAYKGYIRKNQ
ncbi:uncharacterized protein LOC144327122 [Podarcis muralis]